MSVFPLAVIALLSAQAPAPDSVPGGSEYTIEPERWEISYDIAIQPYLDDYRRCLDYGNRIFNGEPNVEAQHRADIPRCAKVKLEAIRQSNSALERRGRAELFPPSEVERTFTIFEQIHIERGRNLDEQLQLQVRANEEAMRRYEAQIAARDAALAEQDK